MIYLDNAATSLYKPDEVVQAVYHAMSGETGNALRGVNDASVNALKILTNTRELLCELFGFDNPSRVAFSFNATDSLNMAISGLLNIGDHVITTVMEHNSVLRPLYRLEEKGLKLTVLPMNSKYVVDIEELERAIRPDTRAVVLTHASNVTGNVNDLEVIGRICKKHGVLFIVDAAQTAGILPVDMKKMHIDVLCFSGHKGLLGPQGTGGICVAEGIQIRPFRVGGSGIRTFDKHQPTEYPSVLEAGTLNVQGIAGLCAGVKYILDNGVWKIHKKEMEYYNEFLCEIRNIPGIKLYGDVDDVHHTPVVSINIENYDSACVSDELMQRFNIATRSGGHCAPLLHEAFNTVEQGMVRFSFSHKNTPEDIKAAIEAVRILATE